MTRRELESALEDRCVAKVEALGGLALKLSIPGVRGFPDRSVLMPPVEQFRSTQPASIFFCEFKRLKTGVVSSQQHKWRVLLTQLGFKVFTIDNDAAFDAVLEEWR